MLNSLVREMNINNLINLQVYNYKLSIVNEKYILL